MFKIIYAVVEERMPEGFVDNLVFAKDEYEMMLFGTEVCIEVNGEICTCPSHTGIVYKSGQQVHYYAKEGLDAQGIIKHYYTGVDLSYLKTKE